MALRGWTWEVATGPAGLGDQPLRAAVQAAIPDEAVQAAIEQTGSRERRRRVLPTALVVTLVVAMGLWTAESIRHALAAGVDGWREGTRPDGGSWRLPSTAAISRARQRTGPRVLQVLFGAVAGPRATPATPGACRSGLRLMAIDGTTLDVADTPANARACGYPGTGRSTGQGAFPQLRAVALIEVGTHLLCDVVLRPCHAGAGPAGRRLLRSVGPGMLLLWDRNFHSYPMITATQARGAALLGRAKLGLVFEPTELLGDGSFLAKVYPDAHARTRDRAGQVVRVSAYTLATADAPDPGPPRYRLVTSLLDEHAYPAETLAATYHERWESETTLDELKGHPWAHPRPLRSQHPREVVQEVSGLLLAHLAIRTLMHQAAGQQGLDPDQLSFTAALRVLRRAIPRAQRTWPEAFPLFRPGC